MPIDDAQFKMALSHFASGVTVVTTEHDGTAYGMTVASFTSLSLHPPLVLVCIENGVKTHQAIAASGKFCVSILARDQSALSSRFASKVEDRFAGVETIRGALDLPLLANSVATLECRVTAALPGGDHTIFVGEVERSSTRETAPLLYFRGGYHEIRD